ncbi:MAG: response regulator transcription factor [Anaerolineales bacterium]|nr:response regulator transcription factor [Anaerolineales bacterium]
MNTILLVDDHVLFREGLRSLANRWADFEVIGEASNGQEALDMARELLPDVILMDITMPVMDGLEATRKIKRELPTSRIIMLTVSKDEDNLFEAIKAGAHGYVLKDTPSRRLHDFLRGAMRGEAPMSGAIAAKVLKEFNKPISSDNDPCLALTEPLSDRERQVLQLVSEGLTNYEIGESLFLSESTVKKHIANILDKLHLSNRVQAAVYAVREGLLEE